MVEMQVMQELLLVHVTIGRLGVYSRGRSLRSQNLHERKRSAERHRDLPRAFYARPAEKSDLPKPKHLPGKEITG
jgi:hypothetical protein